MLKIRPWQQSDAAFVCALRNDPSLMRWYRQDEPIEVAEQKRFIKKTPKGQVIEYIGTPIGVLWIKQTGELSLVLNPEHSWVLYDLNLDETWGEVFATNPLLKSLLNVGFKVVEVREKAYFKKLYGWQDVIKVEKNFMRTDYAVSTPTSTTSKM